MLVRMVLTPRETSHVVASRKSGQMMPRLYEIIGLPATTPVAELGCAADKYSQSLFDRASRGDKNAQSKLIELQVAYLTWAYADRKPQRSPGFKY